MPFEKPESLRILVSVYSELCGAQRVKSLSVVMRLHLRYTDPSCTTASYVTGIRRALNFHPILREV